ncbi:cytochrome c oxidase subunit NDUFA4-like [Leptopilina heterotoma]|uniref:cytochrome c oxidase subunit NDUFA4-like n=1 Tax=Leptopilina heterotoma TaxID=63436 RepID=UPI001CA9745C|nr:cytochrome c oxidase subunit NDUFA4-like [Leptopilina heterotoma]
MPAMLGMSMKSVKAHPSLIPLYVCIFAGGAAVVGYMSRCALKNPDVSWDLKNNPEPWQKYENKRYQFLDPVGAKGWTTPKRMNSIWE